MGVADSGELWTPCWPGESRNAKPGSVPLLCALDQSALDSGSWVLASEMHFENPPPLASFSQQGSRPRGGQTRIMDPRWVSVLMHRIKEHEPVMEARKKPSSNHQGPGPSTEEKPDKPRGHQRGEGAERPKTRPSLTLAALLPCNSQ